ncbi:MAG: ATPase domain-containing protein, partial [Sulfolobales archaeon]
MSSGSSSVMDYSKRVKQRDEIVRISTGIKELDEAIEGGVPRGSWIAITGEPGTGKSILCMHYAWAGLKAGDPVVYVTTEAEFR